MSERVVDLLEAIEIDVEKRDLVLLLAAARDRFAQTIDEEAAIPEPRQAVVMRQLNEMALAPLLFGHVADRDRSDAP